MKRVSWPSRAPLLAGAYLVVMVYLTLYPLHFYRPFWDLMWRSFPILPVELYPDPLAGWALTVLAGLPLGALSAAAVPRWTLPRLVLLWLALSGAMAMLGLSQVLFTDLVLDRFDPRLVPLGIGLGMLGWWLAGPALLDTARAWLARAAAVGSRWLASGWSSRLALVSIAGVVALTLKAGADGSEGLWQPTALVWAWWMFLVGLFSAAAMRPGAGSWTDGLRRLLLWALLAGAAWVLAGMPLPSLHSRVLWGQQLGLLVGLGVGWLGAMFGVARRLRVPAPVLPWLGRAGWLLLSLLLLLPLAPGVGLAELADAWRPASLGQLPGAVGEQVYAVIKSAMLWVPVGLLYALAGERLLLRAWVAAVLAGGALVGAPWLLDTPLGLLTEIGGALWGLVAGVWVARETALGQVAQTGVAATDEAPPVAPAQVSQPPGQEVAVDQPAPLEVALAPGPASGQASVPGSGQHSGHSGSAGFRHRGVPPVTVAPTVRWRSRDAADEATAAVVAPRFRAREVVAPPTGLAPVAPPPAMSAASGAPAAAEPVSNAHRRGAPEILPWLVRFATLAILAVVAWLVSGFPRWPLGLGVGLALYAAVLWRWPAAALLVVPAALPLLDLAPWTGRSFVDAYDLLVTVTLAMTLWHLRPGTGVRLASPVAIALAVVVLAWSIAMLRGLLPLSPWDVNALATYWTSYNALRVFKGLAIGLVLLLVLRQALVRDPNSAQRWMLFGIWLGLLGVVVFGVREHSLFAGFGDLQAPYRITFGFSSMHTGGGHIETWLVLVIPFLWLWPTVSRHPAWLLLGVVLLAGASYLTVLTAARGGVAALVVVAALLTLGLLRRTVAGHRFGGTLAGALAAVALIIGLLAVSGGGYLGERLERSEKDLDTRLGHWATALDMRDAGPVTAVFGDGLGSFPRAYLGSPLAATRPTSHRFERRAGQAYLTLGSGETLYLAQRVELQPGTGYRLRVRARSRDVNARLDTPLCEKQLLDSHQCRWSSVQVEGNGHWRDYEKWIEPGGLGGGAWWARRPVELALLNPVRGSSIDIDRVALIGPAGQDLLANGGFEQGGDYWFYKTHDHLPWHIKNLWVSLLFEQGWFGVIAFAALLLAVLIPLARRLWAGEALATVLLAAIAGFLAVGLVGSPFDAPRLTGLFFGVLLFAALTGKRPIPND